jgi:N-methylhydantoinase B/oxoprolinase/acetone carboxylase alpha subunit
LERDAITLSVVNNRLVNICREMGIAMMKTAYSPIFNEGLDFSCCLFNAQGEMISQAEFCPAQLGASIYVVEWSIKEIGVENLKPGDVILHNDPYRGGCHIPEHCFIKPIFYNSKLAGLAANIGHLAEIGGKNPGGFAGDATEVYQEGLRIPPVKAVKEGVYDEDLWKLIMSNHRTPRNTLGDFSAMIGSLNVAERRLITLLDEYGYEDFCEINNELMDVAEKRMRAEIASLPDGEYSFEDCMEDDGLISQPTYIRANIIIDGDTLIVDYSKSDPQARGPINATYGVTASATFNAVFHVTDPDIPHNIGAYRPIKIIAPPGTVVNVTHPAPEVGGNTETHPRIWEILIGAFSKAIPEKVAASDGGTCCNFLFGGIHPDTNQYYANYHLEGGGWGARATKDGNHTIIVPNGNCRNTPVEIFETRYPLIADSYSLVGDSGGPGKFRGGLGSRRKFTVKAPEITLSTLFDRVKIKPFGLFGGKGGGNASLTIKKKGKNKFEPFTKAYHTASPSKFSSLTIHEGDEIILTSPGGGGYGDPFQRDPELVLKDVEDGLVSKKAARDEYGVVIEETPKGLVVDDAATAHLRKSMRKG